MATSTREAGFSAAWIEDAEKYGRQEAAAETALPGGKA
jgi:hypothetical protein